MIIAYASGNSDPANNPSVNPGISLAGTSLPATVTVYGAATDTNDPSATFSWAWTVLDPATGVTLSSSATQDVDVTVDAWHNVRLHLVATNTATSETSETNVLIAPSSSFVDVRVSSENKSIEIPAKGARDWHTQLTQWATAIENSAPAPSDIDLNDLGDVSTATGPQVDQLTGGGYATLNTTLHTHYGNQVDAATNTTQGTVALESALPAGTIPKVLVNERLAFTQSADLSVDPAQAGAFSTKIIAHSAAATFHPHVLFQAVEEIKVTDLSITLLDAGDAPGDYEFDLCTGTAANVAAFTMQKNGLSLTGTSSSAYYPMVIEHLFTTPPTISAGDYFGVVIKQSPIEADAGRCLRVTIRAIRELN